MLVGLKKKMILVDKGINFQSNKIQIFFSLQKKNICRKNLFKMGVKVIPTLATLSQVVAQPQGGCAVSIAGAAMRCVNNPFCSPSEPFWASNTQALTKPNNIS